jgi:hypothetical protein
MQANVLSDELKALGGGSAHIEKYRVVVYVAPLTRKGICIVKAATGEVIVRDPRAPLDATGPRVNRSFSIPHCVLASEDANGRSFNGKVSEVSPPTLRPVPCSAASLQVDS